MFTLDINFLKDREPEVRESTAVPIADTQFLIGGAAAAVVAIAIVGGMYLFSQSQIDGKQAELAKLTSEEKVLEDQLVKLKGSEESIKAVEARNQALTNLLVQDIPASVIMQDIRTRTPSNIQVSSVTINQTDKKVAIAGSAKGFDEANDFLLILQGSAYLDPKLTKLASAKKLPPQKDVKITLVEYQITSSLTNKTADILLSDLEKSEAAGAVTKIKLLQEKGVIAK
jgi:type IV pilus assembly protein PilN